MGLIERLLPRLKKIEYNKSVCSLYDIIISRVNCPYIFISDRYFNLISDDAAMRAYRAFEKYRRRYRAELWDCDNSAQTCATIMKLYFIDKGINAPVGFTWTQRHAYVVYVNMMKEVKFMESFTGDICGMPPELRFIII